MFFTTIDHPSMWQHAVYCLKNNEYCDSYHENCLLFGILRAFNRTVSIGFRKLILKCGNSQDAWKKSFHDATPTYNTILTAKHIKNCVRDSQCVQFSAAKRRK